MKIFLFICLAFVAAQVSAAPTRKEEEDAITPAVTSNDVPSDVNIIKSTEETAQQKQDEKPEEKHELKAEMKPDVQQKKYEEKPENKPEAKAVEKAEPKVDEKNEVKEAEKVEKQAEKVEKTEEIPTTVEKPSVEMPKSEKASKTVDKSLPDASKKVQSDKHDKTEAKKNDSKKGNDSRSFFGRIYDALSSAIFGHTEQSKNLPTSSVVEISYEETPIKSKLVEVIPGEENDYVDNFNNFDNFNSITNFDHFDNFNNFDNVDGGGFNDIDVTIIPVHAHSPQLEVVRESSMVPRFLGFRNLLNGIPSMFRYERPSNVFEESRRHGLEGATLSRFFG